MGIDGLLPITKNKLSFLSMLEKKKDSEYVNLSNRYI